MTGTIRDIVMGNVVNLVVLKELWGDNPGAILDNLIYPFAMPKRLGAFFSRQYGKTLAHVCLFVSCHAHYQVYVWESLLCLLELAHVPVMVR